MGKPIFLHTETGDIAGPFHEKRGGDSALRERDSSMAYLLGRLLATLAASSSKYTAYVEQPDGLALDKLQDLFKEMDANPKPSGVIAPFTSGLGKDHGVPNELLKATDLSGVERALKVMSTEGLDSVIVCQTSDLYEIIDKCYHYQIGKEFIHRFIIFSLLLKGNITRSHTLKQCNYMGCARPEFQVQVVRERNLERALKEQVMILLNPDVIRKASPDFFTIQLQGGRF
jgi:hypothetical protein